MGGRSFTNTKIGTQRYGVLLCSEASKPLKCSIRELKKLGEWKKKGTKNRDAGFMYRA